MRPNGHAEVHIARRPPTVTPGRIRPVADGDPPSDTRSNAASPREDPPDPPDAPPREDSSDASPLEARARAVAAAGVLEPLRAAHELARLEADVSRAAIAADARASGHLPEGRPLVGRVSRWVAHCRRLDLAEPVARGERLLGVLAEDEVAFWHAEVDRAVRADDPEACFVALRQASDLAHEARVRDGTDPGIHPGRARVEAAFSAAVDRAPPNEATRRAWATDLLDRADARLVEADDLPPAEAAERFGAVARDLAWHRRAIEKRRGPLRARLGHKLRRLAAERDERELQARLEARFGAAAVGHFERAILALIFLVLGILFVEAVFEVSPLARYWLAVADTAACAVFLWDFFFRLFLVRRKGRWFFRHVWVDFLPCLPFGLFTLDLGGADPIRAGRAIRLLRLTRVARYLRVLMPVIRLARAFGFLARGLDRLVRRYGSLLNRDVILYPTRAERLRALGREGDPLRRLERLEATVDGLWREVLGGAPPAERARVAACRLDALERMREGTRARPRRGAAARAATPRAEDRAVPAEVLIARLGHATAEAIEAEHAPDLVQRLARALRTFARPPLCWFPVLRRYVPRLGVRMTDAEVVAAGARHVASRLDAHLARWFFFADLYGTITPAEFVDRVGATLVRGAFRPAYRLTLFGSGFLLVDLFLSISPSSWLHAMATLLARFVATPLVVIGIACIALLALGWWLQRVAGEATAFLEQTALAQFLPLMESVKGRFLARDGTIFARRVLAPEARLRGDDAEGVLEDRRRRFSDGVKAWLLEAQPRGEASASFDALDRAILLHRDAMDGALFDANDNRTTNQLLGNPALRAFARGAGCIAARERKALRSLDLAQQRRAFSGPYLWFSLVTRAITHAAARLIVEYNRYAIPLEELPLASDPERRARETWLGRAHAGAGDEPAREADAEHVTTAFTALHFLDDDPRRDREVLERFGRDVLLRLRHDRRALFRRVFGTYPLHARPHEQRVLNLYRLYEDGLAGGRAFLLPLRGLLGALRWLGRAWRWFVRAFREIRTPRLRAGPLEEAEADFATAVRKIDRMRGPVVRTAIDLRARVDCEYLGVPLPGAPTSGLEEVGVERDLEFLGAEDGFRARVGVERERARADLFRVQALLQGGLLRRVASHLHVEPEQLTREHVRALVFAFRSDLDGIRSRLVGQDVVRHVAADAAAHPLLARRAAAPWRLRRAFARWWRREGRGGRAERRAAWRAVAHDVDGAARALLAVDADRPDGVRAEGERRLAEALRHPARLSEQLVTLRIVQVLGLIDVLNYRTHVWRLGRYEEDGDDPGRLLDLDGQAVRARLGGPRVAGREAPQPIDRPPSTASTTPVT